MRYLLVVLLLLATVVVYIFAKASNSGAGWEKRHWPVDEPWKVKR